MGRIKEKNLEMVFVFLFHVLCVCVLDLCMCVNRVGLGLGAARVRVGGPIEGPRDADPRVKGALVVLAGGRGRSVRRDIEKAQ